MLLSHFFSVFTTFKSSNCKTLCTLSLFSNDFHLHRSAREIIIFHDHHCIFDNISSVLRCNLPVVFIVWLAGVLPGRMATPFCAKQQQPNGGIVAHGHHKTAIDGLWKHKWCNIDFTLLPATTNASHPETRQQTRTPAKFVQTANHLLPASNRSTNCRARFTATAPILLPKQPLSCLCHQQHQRSSDW